MKKILTLLFTLTLVTGNLFSQAKLDYSSKWFLGINVGGTWQTTDVQNRSNMGYGYGLTLGKSFNYDYGKRISFDIRARYLRGFWYGQNTDSTSFNPSYAGVLSQGETNYKDSVGFSVNNFQTDLHRLALELVIHANGIKERTNWDPYIFGGIGITWHQTYGNLTNNGLLYDYKGLSSLNSSTLKSLLDGSYETALDGSQKNIYRSSFMPSLGFGIGYQLTKGISIGLEHKTTFTGIDNFDGVVTASKYKQDIYHYTSGYIKFQLGGGRKPKDDYDQVQTPAPITPTTSTQLPVVTFVNPSVTNTVVNTANYTISADVNYVNGRENIVFKQEGISTSNFTYNTTTKRLESNVVLNLGQNTFEIKGTNTVGSDVKSTIVIYKREEGAPPIVTITNPSITQITVNNPSYTLTSTILNVQQASQVSITVNGQNHGSFTFNPSTSILTSSLTLVTGTNTITVKGVNPFGTDSKTTTIIYQKPATVIPPVVTFVTPNVDPFTTTSPQYNVSATVLNVPTASGITVNMNGTNITSFLFNASSSLVSFPVNLIEGANSITITGTNTAGTDSEIQTIIYQKPIIVNPPVVTFVTPNVDPFTTTSPQYNVSATVLNVPTASGITVNMNGTNITSFLFNASSSLVSFPVNLIEGANSITITGTNTAGTDSEIQTIIYQKPVVINPPVVTFVTPNVDPFTTTSPQYNVSATVLNVTAASGITVNMNGTNITSFLFNASSSLVSFPVNLIEGANSITITGTNTAGTDSEIQTIIYQKPVVINPPVVTFLTPNVDPFTTTSPQYNVSATVLNVPTVSGITVNMNGTNITSFLFNASSSLVSFPVNLIEGANSITITGTNTAGTDSEIQTIIYQKPVVINPPVVTFINPATSGTFVTVESCTMISTIFNVENISQIQITQNGQIINTSSYTFDVATKKAIFNTILTEGNNLFTVKGTNSAGTDSETSSIFYRKSAPPCQIPTISILTPTQNETSLNTVIFTATLTNITSLSQIHFVLNGADITDGTFNPISKVFSKSVVLAEGVNIFNIAVLNDCGSAKDQKNISYVPNVTPPCVAPTISITNSSEANNSTTKNQTFTLSALLNNINENSQISIKQNSIVLNFVFNPITHIVQINEHLKPGLNKFVIEVTNVCGKDVKNHVVTLQNTQNVDVNINTPIITITNPTSFPANIEIGTTIITGNITKVTNINQVVITVNGQVVNSFNPIFSGSGMTFQFPIDATSQVPIYELVISGTTPFGTAKKIGSLVVKPSRTTPTMGTSGKTTGTPITPPTPTGKGGK